MPKPSNCISVTKAKQLQANWMSTRAVDIENGLGSKDVCAVTFNIDQLQEYIDYVKEECRASNIENPGIRVFFAAYNNDQTDKATVFFCATDSDDGNSDNNYAIDPLNVGQGGWPPKVF